MQLSTRSLGHQSVDERQEGIEIGIEPKVVIYDEGDQLSLVKRSIEESQVDPKQADTRQHSSYLHPRDCNSCIDCLIPDPHGFLPQIWYPLIYAGKVFCRAPDVVALIATVHFPLSLNRGIRQFASLCSITPRTSRYSHYVFPPFILAIICSFQTSFSFLRSIHCAIEWRGKGSFDFVASIPR